MVDNGYCGCVRERRHTTNTLGLHRRLAVLDRLGRISVYVLTARRYGVNARNGEWRDSYETEYLIMPASFGMWVAIMVMYIFSTRNGCDFITWIQRKCFGRSIIPSVPNL